MSGGGDHPVPFFRPDIASEDVDAVANVLRGGWLTTGEVTQAFEHEFATQVGAKHALAVNSCTAALHLALAAAGVGPGDEVLVPTMTFAATAEVVLHVGARPVLVDCLPETLEIDVEHALSLVTARTAAVIPVHYAGQPCDMDALLAMAAEYQLLVIEDAAHAFPADYHGRPIGSIGDVTCFSFYSNKTITTGEGGMLTTDDADLADRARRLSLHGLSRDAWRRFRTGAGWDYGIVDVGFKYNITDMASALGRSQLRRATAFRDGRARAVAAYVGQLHGLPLEPLAVRSRRTHAWHLFVVGLKLDTSSISRDELVSGLADRGIGTSVHYRPLHLHPLYRERFGYEPPDLPAATRRFEEILSLPLFPSMTDREVNRVVDALGSVLS